MVNMSYCRFENTSYDIRDCLGAMQEALEDGKTLQEFYNRLSDYEKHGFKSILSSIQDILDIVENEELVTE